MVAATVRTIFAQTDAKLASQLRMVSDSLRDRSPGVSDVLDDTEADLTAYADYPRADWRKVWSTNPLERLHKETKRRCDVVGILPDDTSVIYLVGAVLSE